MVRYSHRPMDIEALSEGQHVKVDLTGLKVGRITIGAGLASTGAVLGIDADRDVVTIELDDPIDGLNVLEASAELLTPVDTVSAATPEAPNGTEAPPAPGGPW